MRDTAPTEISEIHGAVLINRSPTEDARGLFRDMLRCDSKGDDSLKWAIKQVSVSQSHRDVVRGIHYSPTDGPGQYWQAVTCASGYVVDVLVDLRVDSPTFGQRWVIEFNGMADMTVVIPPGVGHGFRSLAGSVTMIYAMSVPFPEAVTMAIRPDCAPELGFDPSYKATIMSSKDREAPTLEAAIELGMLPRYLQK